MIKKQLKVINKTGLHARPASELVLKAKKFEIKVTIRNLDQDKEAVNAKSVVRIMAEGLKQGTRIEIAADGSDEENAVEELCALVESGFGE